MESDRVFTSFRGLEKGSSRMGRDDTDLTYLAFYFSILEDSVHAIIFDLQKQFWADVN
jgi:hypothetical protein